MGNDLDYVDLGDNLRVEFMSLGERSTCALLTNGGVKCWGKYFVPLVCESYYLTLFS